MDKDKRIKELENALFEIANIGFTFIDESGKWKDYSAQEALAKIHKIADPFWEEYCDCETD